MKLLNMIKEALSEISEEALLMNMGYNDPARSQETLQRFITTNNIYQWLKQGHYDLRYTSQEFLETLMRELDLISIGKDELERYHRRLDAIREMKDTPYIHVNTDLKRGERSHRTLFYMAREKYITVDKERLALKNISEILSIIGKKVRVHYVVNHGKLRIWGRIEHYLYHHSDSSEYLFDTEGTLVEEKRIYLDQEQGF